MANCHSRAALNATPTLMFARLFSSNAIDELVAAVVSELQHGLPISALAGNAKRAGRARDSPADKVQQCIDRFAISSRLNLFQKAALGIRLVAALRAAGYEADFSKAFAYDAVRSLAIAMAVKRR